MDRPGRITLVPVSTAARALPAGVTVLEKLISDAEWTEQYNAWQQTIQEMQSPPRTSSVPEIELRYSDYLIETSGDQRVPSDRVSPSNFERILESFTRGQIGWTPLEPVTETIRIFSSPSGDFRVIESNTRIIQRKERRGLARSQLGFELSRAQEITLERLPDNAVENVNLRIVRTRNQFAYSSIARLDLTETRSRKYDPKPSGILSIDTEDGGYSIYYQIELEFLHLKEASATPALKRWMEFRSVAIEKILLMLRDGVQYSLDEKYAVLSKCNAQLNQLRPERIESRGRIDPTLLTRPRNLHSSDIRWGRIYGNVDNRYNFAVTQKADGLRKLLYIYKTTKGIGQIWLLSPPDDAVLVMVSNGFLARHLEGISGGAEAFRERMMKFFNDYQGAIVDGEVIPSENWKTPVNWEGHSVEYRSPDNPRTVWFLAFDMLFSRDGNTLTHLMLKERTESYLRPMTDKFADIFRGTSLHRKLQINAKAYYYLSAPSAFKIIGSESASKAIRPRASDKRGGVGPIYGIRGSENWTGEDRVEYSAAMEFGYYPLYTDVDPEKWFFTRMREVLEWSEGDHLPYKTDGLIFTPQGTYDPLVSLLPDSKRRIGMNGVMEVLKWKPSGDITNDMAVTISDRYPRGRLEVMRGGEYVEFKRYVLDPSQIEDLRRYPARSVFEFELISTSVMHARRRRRDKEYPNSLRVVDDNLKLLTSPIEADTLTGDNFRGWSNYHNRIKTKLLEMASDNGRNGILADFGSGYGGDLRKWRNFRKVYAIEPNSENIAVLHQRLAELIAEDPSWQNKVVPINLAGEDPLPMIPDKSVDCVSLMLCLTFFWEPSCSPIRLRSLLENINRILRVGGRIVLLTIDGNAVEEYFGETFFGGIYQPPLDPVGQPVASVENPDGKDPELGRIGRRFQTEFIVRNSRNEVIVRMEPISNGQLKIDMPGSIVSRGQVAGERIVSNIKRDPNIAGEFVNDTTQIESLVYLRDILRQAKNFVVEKTGRADQELLLTAGQAQFSRFFMWASLTNVANEQFTKGAPTLTPNQIENEMRRRATAQPLVPGAPAVAPLPVVPPQVKSQPAEGDGVTQILDGNYLVSIFLVPDSERALAEASMLQQRFQQTPNPELSAQIASLTPSNLSGVMTVNYPHRVTYRAAFPNKTLVRVACIPDTPDNFFHAFLHGAISRYWIDDRYNVRVELANNAKQAFAIYLASGEPTVDIMQKMFQYISGTLDKYIPFGQKYPLQLLQDYFREYLTGRFPLDEALYPMIALCFRVHIVIFSSTGSRAELSYTTMLDVDSNVYKFPRTIVLLKFPKLIPIRYELICIRDNARGLNIPNFDSTDPDIVELRRNFSEVEGWQIYEDRKARGLPVFKF